MNPAYRFPLSWITVSSSGGPGDLRCPQPFRTIDHTQHTLVDVQTTIQQAPQKLTANALVLRGRLHEAQHHLFAFDRDAQRNHHLVIAEGLTVKEHGHDPACHDPRIKVRTYPTVPLSGEIGSLTRSRMAAILPGREMRG